MSFFFGKVWNFVGFQEAEIRSKMVLRGQKWKVVKKEEEVMAVMGPTQWAWEGGRKQGKKDMGGEKSIRACNGARLQLHTLPNGAAPVSKQHY